MAVNRYARGAHLSEAQVRRLARLFALEVEATTASRLAGISRRTVNRYYREFRERLAHAAEQEAAASRNGARGFAGPGRPGPGSAARQERTRPRAFGIQVRQGRVHTEIVEPESHRRGRPTVVSRDVDLRASYDAVVLLNSRHRSRLVRCRAGVRESSTRPRIDRIESFWSATKSRLARRRGVHRRYFYLHLKECEFRFNHRTADLYPALLAMMRRDPIK